MNYEMYREKLITLQAEERSILKANQKKCSEIQEEINKLLEMDTDFVQTYGIEIDFLRNIVIDRLAQDSEYANNFKSNLETEVKKITDLLGGILG